MPIQYELFTGLEARLIDPQEIPWPADSVVAYAIEDNEIIGRVGLLQFPHIEGTWIRDDKRNGFILMRLMNKVEEVLENENRASVFSFAESNNTEVQDYLKRLGYVEMPLKIFAKKLNTNNNEQKVA